MANLSDAASICKEVDEAIKDLPCYVALTGGALYKEGDRKDIDLLFYRVRQEPHPLKAEILMALGALGIKFLGGYNWCTKAVYKGFDIDLFFPELYPEISESSDKY